MDVEGQLAGSEPAYGFTARLARVGFEEARRRITEALANEGFGVLTEIDVQATLKKKLGTDFRKYVILGACNPKLAERALSSELGIGLLLPCNVCVWQEGETSVVSIADPNAMFQIVQSPRLQPIADEAGRRLRAALEACQAPATH